MDNHRFQPGFRFFTVDGVILAVGAVLAAWLMREHFWIGVGVAFVVAHFFLFCNIVRMSRPLELVWSGVFVVVATLAAIEVIQWPVSLAIALATTAILVTIEARRVSYHGVGWQVINPRLPEWWEGQQGNE
ncbi:MAG: hypothetical protein SGJ20_14430 [Planctomycetota bacterium]|nr:hypothetical protein [Planctomycetota bacterium]